jgi:FlaG/FlaF family flagellin (archaellin)
MEHPPQEEQKQEHGVGPIVGVIIIVAVMVAGGIYFILSETGKGGQAPTNEQATTEE